MCVLEGISLSEKEDDCVFLTDSLDVRSEVLLVYHEHVLLVWQLMNVVAVDQQALVSLQEVVAEPSQPEGNADFLVVDRHVVGTQDRQGRFSGALVADVHHFVCVFRVLLGGNYNAFYFSILAKEGFLLQKRFVDQLLWEAFDVDQVSLDESEFVQKCLPLFLAFRLFLLPVLSIH